MINFRSTDKIEQFRSDHGDDIKNGEQKAGQNGGGVDKKI